jgi:hypothetical protein
MTALVREDDARLLTDRIRAKLETIIVNRDAVVPLIHQARESGVHEVLGYKSWTAYVESEFGGVLPQLTRAERQPLVEELASIGMSTRAIAPIVGASQSTAARDLSTESSDSVDRSRVVHGRDGRTRTVPRKPDPRVTDWMESDQELQDAQYMASFSRAVANGDNFLEFDPERIGPLANDLTMRVLEDLPSRVEHFLNKAKAARSGLRLVNGGTQ